MSTFRAGWVDTGNFQIPVGAGGAFRGPKTNERVLGVQSGAALYVKDKSAGDDGETTGWTKAIDIASYSYGAVIKLTNGSGGSLTITDATIRGKLVTQLQGQEGFLHDSHVNHGDIAENGENRMEWGNDSIVTLDQTNQVADYLWKEYNARRHTYVLELTGTRYYLEPGDWWRLQIGSAGNIEYIDSLCKVMTVETERDAHGLGITRLILKEVQEAWKNDSNAVARFIASGDTRFLVMDPGTQVIGSKYYGGTANRYCDGTADEVEINAAIAALSETYGGGTVYLPKGTYITAAAIEMKSNVKLQMEPGTIIEKNCNDYGIEAVGGSGTELTGVEICGGKVTRNAADTNTKALIYFEYCDNSVINGVTVDDSYGEGVSCHLSDGLSIINSTFTDNGTSVTTDQGLEIVDCIGFFVSGCTFTDSASANIFVKYNATSPTGTISGCTSTGGYYGMYLDGAVDIRIENSIFTGASHDGIVGATCVRVAIVSCQPKSNTWSGIYLSACTDVLISGCILNDNSRKGIDISGAALRVVIASNQISGNSSAAIYTYGDKHSITGNTIYDNGLNGITTIGADGCAITGNSIDSNTGDGIVLGNSTDNCPVSNNIVTANSGTGINIAGGGTACDRNIITGNRVSGNTTAQITDNGTNTTQTGNDVT